MSGMLNIGLTGLNAAQLQLNTASHNIVNAGTTGYTRQTVGQSTNDPIFSGVGFFGQGTRIASVARQYSQFLENQVLSADNRRSEFSAYSAQISQINNLLADPLAGLSPAMQQFFAGVQEVAANPTSVPGRQALISSAEALAARFHLMDGRLTEIRQGVEGQIGTTIDSINTLAGEIAQLNQRIVVAQAAGPGVPANDLLDQRNVLVAELNKLVKTTVVSEGDGQLNVFIGSGQPLVLGQTVSRLGTLANADDPTRQSIALITPNGTRMELPERLLTGGELGGLLAFRRESLDVARDQLNRIARQFADAFNTQHRQGVTLDGTPGGDFFNLDIVKLDTGSVADLPGVSIVNDNLLTNDRYGYDNASGILTRLSDGATWDDPNDMANELGFEVTAGGAAGTYYIEPLRNAARDLAVAFSDPRRIAAGLPEGSPMSVEIPSTNGGTAIVSNISTIDNDTPNFPAFTLEFDAITNQLTGLPAGYSLGPDDVFDPLADAAGKLFTITSPGGFSFDFRLSGAPVGGDQFSFTPVMDRAADNRNAVALGALQTTKTMLVDANGNPTASFQSAYSQLVSQVGNKAREIQVGEQAQQALLRQASDARDALSGVNLDEEAANLLRFQQAYQAAGRVMSVAQRLFDELVSIGR